MKTRYPKYLNRNGIPHEILFKQTRQKLKEFESRRLLVEALAKAKRADLDTPGEQRVGGSDQVGDQK